LEVINEKDESDMIEIMLSDIATIKIEEKYNSISLKGKNNLEKAFTFQADVEVIEDTLASAGMPSSSDFNEKQTMEENLKVLLLITGLRMKHFPYLFPCITPQFRDETLSFLFCERYTGGIIKRDGEEWFYDAKKKLVISDLGVENKLTFSWDGSKLLPQDKFASRLGNGVWDGFQLVWHPGEDAEGIMLFIFANFVAYSTFFLLNRLSFACCERNRNVRSKPDFLSSTFLIIHLKLKATSISFEDDFLFPE
jgi:hypothetical protein